MRCLYFLRKLLRVFAGQTAVAQIGEDFFLEGIAAPFSLVKVGGQLFVHGALDPVPEVHIRLCKQGIVGFAADQEVVLIFPAFPCGLAVQDSVGLLQRSAADLCEKFLPSGPGWPMTA